MVLMHEIRRVQRRKIKRRVGRGGKRGTYSGKGQKGQRARAGHKIRSQEREFLQKIPQKRGTGFDRRYKNQTPNTFVLNLQVINKVYKEDEMVNPKTLMTKGLIEKRFSRQPVVKILGQGELTKKLIIKGCDVSESARQKIEAIGGKC
jgi:large subunit ribosomal protein L15